MARPVTRLKLIGVRAVLSAVIFSLGAGPAASEIKTDAYTVPEYAQTKLPSITSCDAKAKDDGISDMASTGNAYLDSITSTALKVNKAYGKKSDEEEDTDDEGDVDGNATLETDCEKLKVDGASDKLGVDAEKMQCGVVNKEGYRDEMEKRMVDSKKYLACKRGVLDALRGELGCFKKQIAEAEAYMNEVVNGPGGMSEMLKSGNDDIQKIDQEVQDRQAQYQSAVERIEGGEGGNPPGLRQAKDALNTLTKALPKRVVQVNQAVETLRNQQARFETLVSQLSMGRAMECMNTPTQGYRCVKEGTSSANHPEWNGSVSPFTYLKCLHAQSANKLVGGKVIKNASREASYLKASDDAIKIASSKAPSATALPDFSDAKAFASTMKMYTANSPAELGKLLAPTLRDMEVSTGKNMTSQFWSDMNRCYTAAKKEVAKERTESNSPIKASETAMKQSFETTRAENASAFRDLRDTYTQAVKAATGQSLNVDTSRCETASLEDQAKCFDALNSMTDALLTGKVPPTATTLTGPAQSLTNGQEPIHGFSSALAAKNVPARTIQVKCSGVDDCLTQYTNLRTQLKSAVEERKAFQTTYKTQINTKLLNTAKDLASKGLTGVGQAGIVGGGITLNQVAANVEKRKNQLATALSRLGVKEGLDLDAKEIKEPAKGEDGLFKPADLKNLVLAEIEPGLPDTKSKGFTKTTDAITERDEALDKLQDGLEKDFNAIDAKVAECAKDKKKVDCDAKKTVMELSCKEDTKEATLYDAWKDILLALPEKDRAAKMTELTKAVGQKDDNANNAKDGDETNCGRDKKSYLGCINGTTDNEDKGDDGTGGKKNSGDKASTAK